jgi:ribosomal protein S18 acetylase RimI-like enzyme
MHLRRAEPADIPALVECWAAMFAEVGTAPADARLRASFAAYLARKLPAHDFAAWVIEERGTVVSTAALILYDIPGREGATCEGYVINVYTVPLARDRGLARKAMDALLAHARTLPLRKVWLRTAPKAAPLYDRLGFEQRSELREIDLKQG